MQHVVYDGPCPAVEVPAAGDLVAKRGEPVEVDEAVAKALLEQECWKPAETKAQREAREQREREQREEGAAAKKAAAEAVKRVRAERAKKGQRS